MTDPPEWAAPRCRRLCTNDGTWPVLAGAPTSVMLSSPIILGDHPQIAPESAGRPLRRDRDRRDPHAAHDGADRRREGRGARDRPARRGRDRPGRRRCRRSTWTGCTARCATCGRSPASDIRPDDRLRPRRSPSDLDARHAVVGPGRRRVGVAGDRRHRDRRRARRPRQPGPAAAGRASHRRAGPLPARPNGHGRGGLLRRRRRSSTSGVTPDDDDELAEIQRWHGRYLYFAPDEVEPVPRVGPDDEPVADGEP